MLLSVPFERRPESLTDMLEALPQLDPDAPLGNDLHSANHTLLDQSLSVPERVTSLLTWLRRYQPCLFGRLAAAQQKSLEVDVCWLTPAELAEGPELVRDKIQAARRAWKERAAQGLAHGFLVLFNHARLARAAPSQALVRACQALCALYIPENAPIDTDVIYTEAMPLRGTDGKLRLFKGGINVFYAGAHGTRNHDRRVPGGLLISVNSPGHYANSLVVRGLAASLVEAIDSVRDIAWRSIGNGGIGLEGGRSTSWHNLDPSRPPGQCPMKVRPRYVPENFNTRVYSALYHTDVLVPTEVTVDATPLAQAQDAEVWSWLIIDYLTETRFDRDHVNYGLLHGHPIADEAIYHNPWPPRRAVNAPLANY